mmetsp:Transcript_79669/g.176788  ORF Transcript_79669/g.176788 Transcript_79669/m.176788 type:complete len:361 (-) Transcript_79669:1193-2275(-)
MGACLGRASCPEAASYPASEAFLGNHAGPSDRLAWPCPKPFDPMSAVSPRPPCPSSNLYGPFVEMESVQNACDPFPSHDATAQPSSCLVSATTTPIRSPSRAASSPVSSCSSSSSFSWGPPPRHPSHRHRTRCCSVRASSSPYASSSSCFPHPSPPRRGYYSCRDSSWLSCALPRAPPPPHHRPPCPSHLSHQSGCRPSSSSLRRAFSLPARRPPRLSFSSYWRPSSLSSPSLLALLRHCSPLHASPSWPSSQKPPPPRNPRPLSGAKRAPPRQRSHLREASPSSSSPSSSSRRRPLPLAGVQQLRRLALQPRLWPPHCPQRRSKLGVVGARALVLRRRQARALREAALAVVAWWMPQQL